MERVFKLMTKAKPEQAKQVARQVGYEDSVVRSLAYGEFNIDVTRPEGFQINDYNRHLGDDSHHIGGPKATIRVGSDKAIEGVQDESLDRRLEAETARLRDALSDKGYQTHAYQLQTDDLDEITSGQTI
ncbi:MAG: hypothetical protein ABH864_03165 [archaeon]